MDEMDACTRLQLLLELDELKSRTSRANDICSCLQKLITLNGTENGKDVRTDMGMFCKDAGLGKEKTININKIGRL